MGHEHMNFLNMGHEHMNFLTMIGNTYDVVALPDLVIMNTWTSWLWLVTHKQTNCMDYD